MGVQTVFLSCYSSPLGRITMAAEHDSIVGLWFDGQKYDRAGLDASYIQNDELGVFEEARAWLEKYFDGRNPGKVPKLAPAGSDFRQCIFGIMRSIPYGEIMTYGRIAEKAAVILGKKKISAQAVGGAVGHNPISIMIPCHRVVGSDGSLTGYAGGIEKKSRLLELEGIDLNKKQLYIPKHGTDL